MKCAVAILLLSFVGVGISQPVQLTITPAFQAIAVDSLAKIKVRIQSSVRIRAYRVEVEYNPALIKCVYADKDSFFRHGTSLFFITIDSINGKIGVDEALIGAGAGSGEGNLAEIRFRGLRNGTGSLALPFAFVRDSLNQAVTYSVSGASVRVGTGLAVNETKVSEPNVFHLSNYPNPFNSSTTISYSISTEVGRAHLLIYNLLGQMIKDLSPTVTRNQVDRVVWDGRDEKGAAVSSGTYLVRLATEGKSQLRTIQLIK